ncbi:MAG: hypothetical protein MK078_11140 [Crocinitomicaceae bacterium]|nr:hypothetical protein [Crocinitomicaceae bacterium]
MILFKKYWFLAFPLFFFACSKPMTEEEVDDYVLDKMQPDQVYDISVSPTYSRNDEILQVVLYEQNDSVVMVSEEKTTAEYYRYRSIFFKNNEPIYCDEYFEDMADIEEPYRERKIYIHNQEVNSGYERLAGWATGLDDVEYAKAEFELEDFDFDGYYKRAINQEEEFDMKFGEFMEMPEQTYLILENDESGWNTAFMIINSDPFLDNLYTQPDLYEGKSISVYPLFREIDGITRMIYAGGELKD